MSDTPTLDLRRAFDWGIVAVVDADSTDDLPILQRGHAYAATSSALVTVVRHAQDVSVDLDALDPDELIPPFEVWVRCWVDVEPPVSPSFGVDLNVPSGRVQIGDAARWDTMNLRPGLWSVSVEATPLDHPETLDLWFRG